MPTISLRPTRTPGAPSNGTAVAEIVWCAEKKVLIEIVISKQLTSRSDHLKGEGDQLSYPSMSLSDQIEFATSRGN